MAKNPWLQSASAFLALLMMPIWISDYTMPSKGISQFIWSHCIKDVNSPLIATSAFASRQLSHFVHEFCLFLFCEQTIIVNKCVTSQNLGYQRTSDSHPLLKAPQSAS
jgi:hypothetical protein